MINSFSAHPRESGVQGKKIEDQKQAVLDSRFRGNERSAVLMPASPRLIIALLPQLDGREKLLPGF
ncbi:MAG: hypothetical protein WCF15_02340, partial [Pseudolabrys sp.]